MQGRLRARLLHARELEAVEDDRERGRQTRYLDATLILAGRRALARVAYLAERP